jgi:3-phenylpropionate/trans-cinnamate dioxygenase ferredoxin component
MGTEVRACSVTDVPAPSSRRFDLDGHRVCVVHLGEDWYAIGDRCSHADESLSEGDLWVDECEIECPKHGSTFDLRTGEPQALPATEPVPVYEVHLKDDDVMVTLP